ncbi:alpha/beta fold hydrolase [Lunatimonas salinarum]|uniref:alpha/beta fold hydrolase n=1 Tax=Lunatimonas salinarum TaxID=1774590 RepID=UPI001FD872C9|nr:alpha/beta fold hydrolase [Lunatimonas salinarum]
MKTQKRLFVLFTFLLCLAFFGTASAQLAPLRLATFDMDATPPVGSYLAYDQMEKAGELGLRARGIVLSGSGLPIVLCAIDWIGIANESQDFFKSVIAEAAGTIPSRVSVHTVHQHDAPISDFSAERILKAAGIDPLSYEGTFQRAFGHHLAQTIRKSLVYAVPVTHIGHGEAKVEKVASNRRIIGSDGKAIHSRTSATKDAAIRAFPEGVIDPTVSLLSFWRDDTPVAVLSFYAVHPQSYYLTKIANPDFPGLARYLRELEVPEALHVHFNGAGANVTAGKYNDGSKENRLILAQRLAAGMKAAWENTQKTPISGNEIDWKVVNVDLPIAANVAQIRQEMLEKDMRWRTNYLQKLAWKERMESGYSNPISCLYLGDTRVLLLPGELFVEYQLAAKRYKPGLQVHMAAYADYGPFYIGTAAAYEQGGYEISTSPTTAAAEPIVSKAINQLLDYKPIKSDLIPAITQKKPEKGGISNLGEWQQNRQEVLRNMEKVMGALPSREQVQTPRVDYLDTLTNEYFTRYTISYEAHSGFWVPAFLYLPRETRSLGTPAILALHSTGDPGKKIVDGQTTLENRAVARELAARGYVVLAPDYPSFGDLKDHDFETDGFESATMLAIWNHMRGIDLLQALPEVDGSRIGVIGHSLGGHNALFVSAFDERIQVIVSSCGWTPFDYYDIGEEASKRYGGRLGPWAQDRYMPKIREYMPDKRLPFDFTDIISILAPRAFFSNSPTGDGNFDVKGVKHALGEIEPVFKYLGVSENLEVHFPDAGHDFPLEVRQAAYRFMDRQLSFKPINASIP